MKGLITACIVAALLFLPGCGNMSPRQQQEIDNQNGKIGEIENMANSMKAEIGNLKSQNEIQDSQIGQMQQGLANWQSNYENSGVQIFSGPGGLIVALVGIMAVSVLAFHYRNSSKRSEKTTEILAANIKSQNDPWLEDQVFQAAMFTDVEEDILKVMTKNR